MLLKIEFLKIHFGHIINLKMIIDPIPKRVFGKSTLVGIHTRLGIQNQAISKGHKPNLLRILLPKSVCRGSAAARAQTTQQLSWIPNRVYFLDSY